MSTTKEAFTESNVGHWMRVNIGTYTERDTDEVNCTGMAEDAAAHFGMADEGGPLDDPDHWIWELAVIVADPPSRWLGGDQ